MSTPDNNPTSLVPVERVITHFINGAFVRGQLPLSNRGEDQRLLYNLFVAQAMESVGRSHKKSATEDLKKRLSDTIKRLPTNTMTEVMHVSPFRLSVKVSKPRETFDKDEFIRKCASEFDCSAAHLHRIAALCVKKSAAPVTWDVALSEISTDEMEAAF